MPDTDSPSYRVDQAYCAGQVRRYDRDRYLGALFAPESRRPDLFALYAFNLEIAKTRESVSEMLLGRMRLQWWRDTLAAIFEGTPPQHQVATGLAAAVARHNLSRSLLERLIDARERDLEDAPPPDLATLEAYAADTSSTLTELALATLGVDDPDAPTVAHHAGIGWAMTGLLRAAAAHARERRLYLPDDLMREAGLTPDSVFRLQSSAPAAAVAARLASRARHHIDRARAVWRRPPGAAMPALTPLTVADAVLRRLARRDYDLFAGGLEPSPISRQLRIGWAALRRRV